MTVPRHGVFGEMARIPCEGSNMGTKFGLGECKEAVQDFEGRAKLEKRQKG